jgi:hypothetical protein
MWTTSSAIAADRMVGDATLCLLGHSNATSMRPSVPDAAARGALRPTRDAMADSAAVSDAKKPPGQGSVRNAG